MSFGDVAIMRIYKRIIATNINISLTMLFGTSGEHKLGRDVIKIIAEYCTAANDPVYEEIDTIDGVVIAATDNTSIGAVIPGRKKGDIHVFYETDDQNIMAFGEVVGVIGGATNVIGGATNVIGGATKSNIVVLVEGAYYRIVDS
jgi:hypothetical protein